MDSESFYFSESQSCEFKIPENTQKEDMDMIKGDLAQKILQKKFLILGQIKKDEILLSDHIFECVDMSSAT